MSEKNTNIEVQMGSIVCKYEYETTQYTLTNEKGSISYQYTGEFDHLDVLVAMQYFKLMKK